MVTTPSMGLKRWDQPNDIFSYTELSDNWVAVDAHDHTTGKGVQVPSGGIANLAVTETKIANDAVTAAKIATGAVGDTELAGSIPDTKLASPNNAVWRTIASVSGIMVASTTGTYAMGGDIPTRLGTLTAVASPLVIPWTASQYAVAGKTTRWRLSVFGLVNDVAFGTSTFQWGIWAAGAVSGSAGINVVAGSVVSGSLVSPIQSGDYMGPAASSEFTPADGNYMIACSLGTASMAANSSIGWTTVLQFRHT